MSIERIETFAQRTKVDRLRTAARQALGDLRLRIARERVLEASGEAEDQQTAERVRLGL